jgi:hypothetical protein
MTTLERLSQWRDAGAITAAQFDTLSRIERKERFSIYVELHALLYLGVLAIGAGLLWTVQTHFQSLGAVVIVLALTTTLGLCLYYCFCRALPYSAGEVESPGHAFDYVLYLGCVVFGVLLGYLESRFGLLGEAWDWHVLGSAAVFFLAAYRFDNRLVLSLALSTLAGWFGIRLSRFGLESPDTLRLLAMAYGLLTAGLGAGLHRFGLKPHFLETYLHVAANALFVSFLWGVQSPGTGGLYLLGLLALGALAVTGGLRYHRFAFVAYGVLYPYLGFSVRALDYMTGQTMLAYGVFSASAMVILMVYLARRAGRHE